MSFHAPLEESDNIAVVRILSETEAFAVVHELLEFFWLVSAELIDCHFLLLLLDVCILLGLRSSWESLPRK
jgi:hypothetical protein